MADESLRAALERLVEAAEGMDRFGHHPPDGFELVPEDHFIAIDEACMQARAALAAQPALPQAGLDEERARRAFHDEYEQAGEFSDRRGCDHRTEPWDCQDRAQEFAAAYSSAPAEEM